MKHSRKLKVSIFKEPSSSSTHPFTLENSAKFLDKYTIRNLNKHNSSLSSFTYTDKFNFLSPRDKQKILKKIEENEKSNLQIALKTSTGIDFPSSIRRQKSENMLLSSHRSGNFLKLKKPNYEKRGIKPSKSYIMKNNKDKRGNKRVKYEGLYKLESWKSDPKAEKMPTSARNERRIELALEEMVSGKFSEKNICEKNNFFEDNEKKKKKFNIQKYVKYLGNLKYIPNESQRAAFAEEVYRKNKKTKSFRERIDENKMIVEVEDYSMEPSEIDQNQLRDSIFGDHNKQIWKEGIDRLDIFRYVRRDPKKKGRIESSVISDQNLLKMYKNPEKLRYKPKSKNWKRRAKSCRMSLVEKANYANYNLFCQDLDNLDEKYSELDQRNDVKRFREISTHNDTIVYDMKGNMANFPIKKDSKRKSFRVNKKPKSVKNNFNILHEKRKRGFKVARRNPELFKKCISRDVLVNLPRTVKNVSNDEFHSLERLMNSEGILNFKYMKAQEPAYFETLRKYKAWSKSMMEGDNVNKPLLTLKLSEEKMRKGIVDELTKDKGIEVQVITEKYVRKKNVRRSSTINSKPLLDYYEELDRRVKFLHFAMMVQKTRDKYNVNFKSDILVKRAIERMGKTIEKKEVKCDFKKKVMEIIYFLKKLKSIRINLDELCKYPIFPPRPYLMKKAKHFLISVNYGNYEEVKNMLKESRYLVFQIDTVGKSALHRAVKKGDLKMVKLLLKHFPDINACDYLGKTPLTYALEFNHLKISRTLLKNRALPWHDKSTNYLDLCHTEEFKNLIKKARKFWIGLDLCGSAEEKKLMWKKVGRALKRLDTMNLDFLAISFQSVYNKNK